MADDLSQLRAEGEELGRVRKAMSVADAPSKEELERMVSWLCEQLHDRSGGDPNVWYEEALEKSREGQSDIPDFEVQVDLIKKNYEWWVDSGPANEGPFESLNEALKHLKKLSVQNNCRYSVRSVLVQE